MWALNYEPPRRQERQERRRKLIVFRSILALGTAEALAVDFIMKTAGAVKIDIGSMTVTNQTGTISTQMSVCD
ncbi:MAG: hypothetical protein KME26_31330 [Oscillatoria princeps RMCB-10]|jgi:hypothetical protein|nr:hypothetical protein [Oscillatoria princeps RMCB-10]